jgi:hypothetical protein
LAFARKDFYNLKAGQIDDPKLRIHGKICFRVWLFALLAFLCLGSLAYFSAYFNRTVNYNEDFAINGEWATEDPINLNEDDTDNIYVYHRNNKKGEQETLKIQVRYLTAEQLVEAKTGINKKRESFLLYLEDKTAELKTEAKAEKKAIKKQFKEKEKELKKSLKGKKATLKAALKENKEQRKAALNAVPKHLKELQDEVSAEKRRAKRKKWLGNESFDTYIAFSGNREYTVTLEKSKMLRAINLSPYEIASGYFDGMVYPVLKTSSLLSLDIQPSFKTQKAGKTYIMGFAPGILVNFFMIIWLFFLVISRIAIVLWRIKWSLMPIKAKIVYIDKISNDVLIKIDREIEKAKYNYKGSSNPEAALENFNKMYQENMELNTFTDMAKNMFTAGKASREKVEIEHGRMANIARSYKSRYEIVQIQVLKEQTHYHWLRKKAELHIMQIKYFIEKLPITIKEEFNQAEKLALDKSTGNMDNDISQLLSNISSLDSDFDQNVKREFISTLAKSTQLMKLAGFTNPAVLGVAGLAIAGGLAFLGAWNKNSKIKNELGRGIISLQDQITKIESNRTLAEGFVGRSQNVNKLLVEAFIRYTKMVDELEKIVFPKGNRSKSKAARKAAQDRGELYFSPEELEKVRALGSFCKYMKQVIETDF